MTPRGEFNLEHQLYVQYYVPHTYTYSIHIDTSLCRTMHRKYTTMKKAISVYNKHRVVDRDPSNPDFQTIASKYNTTYDAERSKARMQKREEKLR